MGRRQPFSRRGQQAIRALQEAEHLESVPRLSPGDGVSYGDLARRERGRAEILLEPIGSVEVKSGEAITWENQADEPYKGAHARVVDTLEHPDTISAGASGERMSAAMGAGVLEPAVDAAMSAQAQNSLEKMLCHEMAGAHFAAMRLLQASANPNLPPVELARISNAAARMMGAYQRVV